jgi:hypothetical protein
MSLTKMVINKLTTAMIKPNAIRVSILSKGKTVAKDNPRGRDSAKKTCLPVTLSGTIHCLALRHAAFCTLGVPLTLLTPAK